MTTGAHRPLVYPLMRLLLIEDEARLAGSLRRGLEEEGFVVDVASTGPAGEDAALANAYDVAVVDWRLPGREGPEVVARLRREGLQLPVLMLTALGDVEHRVRGLDAGADDYLAKPFAFEELLARLRALLRRAPTLAEAVPSLGPLSLDAARRQAALDGRPVPLRPKEYAVLEALLRAPGASLSRTVLAERVWGDAVAVSDNALDVTVSGLRQKLADAGAGQAGVALETVRGYGYRLAATG